jgi:NAD(P)-dependent dehydrogenase (short-subunit alcohol dehydrogenase family)
MSGEAYQVVLGATGGIGSALCRRLAATGARLLVAGRDVEKLQVLVESLGARAFPLDAADPDQVNACLSRAREEFGKMDGVASCVGSMLLKPAHLTTAAE